MRRHSTFTYFTEVSCMQVRKRIDIGYSALQHSGSDTTQAFVCSVCAAINQRALPWENDSNRIIGVYPQQSLLANPCITEMSPFWVCVCVFLLPSLPLPLPSLPIVPFLERLGLANRGDQAPRTLHLFTPPSWSLSWLQGTITKKK